MRRPAGRCAAVRGFSLLELLAALAVMLVLAGGAAVWVTGSANTANDTMARAALDRATVAEQRFAQIYGGYTPLPADITWLGADTTLTTGTATGGDVVSVAVGAAGDLGLAALSRSGACVARRVAPVTGDGAAVAVTVPAGAACTGAEALPAGEAAQPAVTARF